MVPVEVHDMNKILLAFDGEPASRKALEATAELARQTGASVAVLCVVRPSRSGSGWPEASSGWDPADPFAAIPEDARRFLAARGVAADAIEAEGDPAKVIERVAEAEGCDTIVVGARRLGALRRLLEGSVSAHVAAHAHEAVLVVR
jgi:nucleotide-binding universal stress UspA family protein